ncbi:C2 NT-type domain-containing protein [Plasmodiophora brassicae]|nr:hypothetical protein PBRA_007146 [Plasmodiophora brassicae]
MARLLRFARGVKPDCVEFVVEIHSLALSAKSSDRIQAVVMRGSKTWSTLPANPTDVGQGCRFVWPSPVRMTSRMYPAKKGATKYEAKSARIVFKKVTKGSGKTVGEVEVNLAEFCDASTQSRQQRRLTKCSDKEAQADISIVANTLTDASPSQIDEDTMAAPSQISPEQSQVEPDEVKPQEATHAKVAKPLLDEIKQRQAPIPAVVMTGPAGNVNNVSHPSSPRAKPDTEGERRGPAPDVPSNKDVDDAPIKPTDLHNHLPAVEKVDDVPEESHRTTGKSDDDSIPSRKDDMDMLMPSSFASFTSIAVGNAIVAHREPDPDMIDDNDVFLPNKADVIDIDLASLGPTKHVHDDVVPEPPVPNDADLGRALMQRDKEIVGLRNELAVEAQDHQDELHKVRMAAQMQIVRLEQDLADRDAELTALRANTATVQGLLQASNDRIEQLVADMRAAAVNDSNLCAQISTLENEIARYRAELGVNGHEHVEDIVAFQDARYERAEQVNRGLRMTLRKLHDQFLVAEQQHEALRVGLERDVADLHAKIASMQSDASACHAELEAKVTTLKGENDLLKAAPNELVADLNERLRIEQVAMQSMKDLVRELQHQIQVGNDALDAQKVNEVAIRHELAEQRDRTTSLEQIRVRLQTELDVAQAALAALQKKLDDSNSQMRNNEADLGDQRRRVADLQAELATERQTTSTQHAAIVDLEHKLIEASTRAGRQAADSQRVEQLNVSLSDLNMQLAASRKTVAELETALQQATDDLDQERQALREQRSEAERLHEEMQRECDRLQNELMSYSTSRDDTDKRVSTLTVQVDDLEAQIATIRAASEQRATALQDAVQVAQRQRQEAETLAENATKELAAVRSDLEAQRNVNGKMVAERSSLEGRLSTRAKAIERAESEMDRLQAQLKEANDATGNLRARQQALERELNEKDAELKRDRDTVAGLEQRVEAMQVEVIASQARAADLQARLATSEDDLRAERQRVADSRSAHARLQADLQALQARMTKEIAAINDAAEAVKTADAARIAELEQRVQQLQGDLERQRAGLSAAEQDAFRDLSAAQQRAIQLEHDLAHAKRDSVEHDRRASRLQGELDTVRHQAESIARLERDLREAVTVGSDHEQRAARLERDMEQLRKEHLDSRAQLQLDLVETKRHGREHEQRVEAVQRELAATMAAIDKERKMSAGLQAVIDDLRQRIDERDGQHDQLRNEMIRVQGELDNAKADVERLAASEARLQAELHAASMGVSKADRQANVIASMEMQIAQQKVEIEKLTAALAKTASATTIAAGVDPADVSKQVKDMQDRHDAVVAQLRAELQQSKEMCVNFEERLISSQVRMSLMQQQSDQLEEQNRMLDAVIDDMVKKQVALTTKRKT